MQAKMYELSVGQQLTCLCFLSLSATPYSHTDIEEEQNENMGIDLIWYK